MSGNVKFNDNSVCFAGGKYWYAINDNHKRLVDDSAVSVDIETLIKSPDFKLMTTGELKRLEIERDKSAPKTAPDLTPDLVQSPSHYQFFEGVEVIEIIASSMTREQFKGYCLGNRIKYRLRAGNKDKLEQEISKSDKYVELYDEHKHLCK